MTWRTAIASPSARPRPSNAADTTPLNVDGRMTPRTTSHCVAPSAIAPSFSSGADDLEDRDRLAERAAEAEQRRRHHTAERRWQDDAAHDLPLRRPERDRAV